MLKVIGTLGTLSLPLQFMPLALYGLLAGYSLALELDFLLHPFLFQLQSLILAYQRSPFNSCVPSEPLKLALQPFLLSMHLHDLFLQVTLCASACDC